MSAPQQSLRLVDKGLQPPSGMNSRRRIPNLRWWIAALLFFSTVINYIDRQTLSILARTIQDDLRFTDIQYSYVVQAFLVAYTLMFLVAGRITDALGTRVGLALFVVWWSVANMLTGLSNSILSFGIFRFLLGIGEPGNYTAAPKAVAEWFPPRERGLAVGIYTAGATIGATIAPPLVVFLAATWGWRSAFVCTGLLGLVWLVPWWFLYHRPDQHPSITPEEWDKLEPHFDNAPAAPERGQMASLRAVVGRRETWLLLISRALTDPLWYFYLFWFPKYLTDSRHLTLSEVGQLAWLVYLAADIGSLVGGWTSGRLIRRGMETVRSRKTVMIFAACLIPLSAVVPLAPSASIAAGICALVVMGHLTWQVTLGVLIVDIYPRALVATAVGVIAAGSGMGGVLATYVVGQVITQSSYTPLFLAMAVLHPIALLLIRCIRCAPERHANR